jgi:transposase
MLDITKTSKKNIQQNPEKVKKWQEEELPNLKLKAEKEGYELYYHDESTLQLCHNIVKTYAPKGQTPTLALQDTKGYQYVCLASSINAKGDMFFQIRPSAFNGEALVVYLEELLKTTTKKVMIIWDNATAHKSEEVKNFLNTETGKRLWLANTPPYSPEFNPDELVWANLKRVQIPNRNAKNIKELTEIATIGMQNIKNNPNLVTSFFNNHNH